MFRSAAKLDVVPACQRVPPIARAQQKNRFMPTASDGIDPGSTCAPSKKAKTGGAALAHHHLAPPGSLTKLDELMHVLKALVCEEDSCSSRWI